MKGIIRFALGVAQVPESLIDDIDKELPGAGRIIADAQTIAPDLQALETLAEAAQPHIDQLLAIYAQAKPHLDKVIPVVKARYPDVVAILPTADQVIQFVEDKQGSS